MLTHLPNAVALRVLGANINRLTARNVVRAGFASPDLRALWHDIVLLIVADVQASE